MLNAKHIYKITFESRRMTIFKVSKYIGKPTFYKHEDCSILFELLYDRPYIVGITRPFKVTLDRSESYWHAD